ncbi:MAG: TonB-dependent receptor [Gammaproteobacteria bacterium]|nr:TonB-dependent receptor [Gammaproteobacteria bacterium]
MIRKNRLISGAALTAILAPNLLLAEGRQIEEVIVTAERQEASIQDTSISITAFTGEFIDDFGIRNQEDLQNFVPATTIQPYDATVRGVGRNFRALGGDPGVATYMNGVYSEDLLTATAATFWDVERIEVLRGPQGTLYGRNAVGGAINILYKEPTEEFAGAMKAIVGDFGTQDYYGAFSGPLIEDKLLGRVNFSYRERDGSIEELGPTRDLDGLGTDNLAIQLKWNVSDTVTLDVRQNWMDIDRSFGGANGGGLVVLNEDGQNSRSTEIVPGYRFVDMVDNNPTTLAAGVTVADAIAAGTINPTASDYYNPNQAVRSFTNPLTGEVRSAQSNRLGIDFADFDGFQNAAASMDGFNTTSAASLANLNSCVFPGDIDGNKLCAATNGLNREEFNQQGTQATLTWDASDSLTLKYIYGQNQLSYVRTTDDDNTYSQFHDRQFYVNHEADYSSHEVQAFYDFSDTFSITSGVFWYDALIDQRGDFYSSVGSARMQNAYADSSALSAGASALTGIPEGTPAGALLGGAPMATLFSAKNTCLVENPGPACARNFGAENSTEALDLNSIALGGGAGAVRNNNLYLSQWYGDDGTNSELDVINGINSIGSDLLYATQTQREAFAAYTQAVWDFADKLTLTVGVRYAWDEVLAEENLYRYSETGGDGFVGLYGGLVGLNSVNGGFELDANGDVALDEWGQPIGTAKATNGGVPFALSVYRPFKRKDEKVTGRINLDWDINDDIMMYFSATSGFRSGGYNLVFFSNTADYDGEELIAYEIGYKGQFIDNTLQINGSFYLYDYETIHTVATEVTSLGGTSTSVLEAPGAEILGAEAEVLWLATDSLTLGGNFSFTPSEYTKDLTILDPGDVSRPTSLYPEQELNEKNINGNQLLQVPELKYTVFGTYGIPLDSGASLDFSSVYSWTDEVYYSPFENEKEKSESYGRLDVRATWTNSDQNIIVAAYVNNILDDVAVLQVLRNGEGEHYRINAGTTLPRMMGLEFTYKLGAY